MALATGPIPRVATDEIIEESWGDSVAQSLNNINEQYSQKLWKPTSELLAGTAAYVGSGDLTTEWFTVGGTGTADPVTVPDWAGKIVTNLSINGAYLTAQGATTYELQLFIGPLGGRRIRRTGIQSRDRTDPNNRDWFAFNWVDRFDVSSLTGTDRAVRVKTSRFSGSQQFAVDTTTDIAVQIIFIDGQVAFYPGI